MRLRSAPTVAPLLLTALLGVACAVPTPTPAARLEARPSPAAAAPTARPAGVPTAGPTPIGPVGTAPTALPAASGVTPSGGSLEAVARQQFGTRLKAVRFARVAHVELPPYMRGPPPLQDPYGPKVPPSPTASIGSEGVLVVATVDYDTGFVPGQVNFPRVSAATFAEFAPKALAVAGYDALEVRAFLNVKDAYGNVTSQVGTKLAINRAIGARINWPSFESWNLMTGVLAGSVGAGCQNEPAIFKVPVTAGCAVDQFTG